MTAIEVPLVGHARSWMLTASATVITVTGILLLIGAWVQLAAMIGALTVIKHLVFFRRYEKVLPFEKSTYWLLLAICLSLVVTGAGAFAFDLPL